MSGPATVSNTDENLYKVFLGNHGSLFILFEYIDLPQYNSMIDFLNLVVSQTPVFMTQLGGYTGAWYLDSTGAASAENFGTNSQTLSTASGAIMTSGDGVLPVTQCGGIPLYLNTVSGDGYAPGQLTLSVAWTGAQMKASVSNGKVLIMGDREFMEQFSLTCPVSAENDRYIANALRFLVKD
jgi:hypothetical protein